MCIPSKPPIATAEALDNEESIVNSEWFEVCFEFSVCSFKAEFDSNREVSRVMRESRTASSQEKISIRKNYSTKRIFCEQGTQGKATAKFAKIFFRFTDRKSVV